MRHPWILTLAIAGALTAGCKREQATPLPAQTTSTPVAVTIGASFPLTGDNASYGQDAKQGIDLALDEANAASNGKYTLRVIYEDDRVDPKTGVSIMEKLVNVDHVPLVLGSAGSNVTLAMAPIANRTKTVLLSPISSAPQVTDAGAYVFRTCPSDAFQADVVSDWIKSRGIKRVGLLYVNNSWGVGLRDAFKRAFERDGGVITDIESSNETDPDFRTQLAKLKASNAEALYLPTYSKQAGRILVQLRDLGIKLPVFGADTWGAPELIATAGRAAEGTFYVAPENFTGPEYQAFATAYRKRYNKEPDFNASSSYDAAHVAVLAVKRVVESRGAISGEALANALGTVEFRGATGVTRFDANGDVSKPFAKFVFRDGKAIGTE